MFSTENQLFKLIKGLALVLLLLLPVTQAFANKVSRGPSSVDEAEEWSADGSTDKADENTDSSGDQQKDSGESESEPSKRQFAPLGTTDLGESKPVPAQDLVRRADVSFSSKQSFVNAYLELLTEGENEFHEAGQPLTREFESAYEARRRLNHCSRFIQEDGEYGEWGQLIDSSLTRFPELSRALLSNSVVGKAGFNSEINVCPRFSSLTQEQRREFWVWVMTSLALYESTCGFDTSNSSNGNAVGIYQLHRSTSDRLPRSLIGNQRCGRISGAEIARPQENILCTLDFIRDGFSGRMSHAPAGLITRAQQFQKLRTANTNLVKLIRKFRACQPARDRPPS